jgi:hypothetical protein
LSNVNGTPPFQWSSQWAVEGEIQLKAIAALAVASGIAMLAAAPADARQGCGPGFHRAPNGMCRPNRDMRLREMRWVEGRYYGGHGYWWHNRWYQHRHRRNGVWIYL